MSSSQWALVSTRFSDTHFRAFFAVMADVIKQINTIIPALKTSQPGKTTLAAITGGTVCAVVLGAELGVVFRLLAPFPPHGGKGACDCKAGGVLIGYIPPPPKLRTRYQDIGGEPSLSMLCVTLCASITSPLVATWKIDGVSTLSNRQFSKEGTCLCMKSAWRGTYKTNICTEILGPIIGWSTVHSSALSETELVLLNLEKAEKYRTTNCHLTNKGGSF